MSDAMRQTFIDESVVKDFIEKIDGRIFTVWFEKKDGTVRKMTCRKDVTKHLKGGESNIFHHSELVSVFEMSIGQYRCFDRTKVLCIRGDGIEIGGSME